MLRLQNMRALRLQRSSLVQKPTTQRSGGVRGISLFKNWKGASSEEHTTERSKRGDTNDPTSNASAAGLKERQENENIADASKSQGTTERGGQKHGKKAKQEHPEAPEPIIGMNDERAQKGN
ncbi:hypothetical protein N7492_007057 [Penicillium capsulatum]|uniref:Uncharacterized protein n=1 Tax=Penicillium capsulatum TaxID=69766 RepID=A0A9W9I4C5_9EURO|nr:hypothetical protein N7492_007057 [Penicillium capsulatum]KAJ6116891.1 hypothetical protein N7512_006616 [Penicillium capsulatum]